MEIEQNKKSAVDLTDLAIGILVLGIIVSIGSVILLGVRDSRLESLPTFNVVNETVSVSGNERVLSKVWVKGVNEVMNQSGMEPITSPNYTLSVSKISGTGTITNITPCARCSESWNVSYSCYNSSQADFKLANDSVVGLGEYGNWFKIIVIVGVAAVVLALIFMAFGRNASSGGGSGDGGIGGEY
jgi:ABC-type transport system involved in multi-copper enzyme maturation permease subunit